jgi:hypothetical protein
MVGSYETSRKFSSFFSSLASLIITHIEHKASKSGSQLPSSSKTPRPKNVRYEKPPNTSPIPSACGKKPSTSSPQHPMPRSSSLGLLKSSPALARPRPPGIDEHLHRQFQIPEIPKTLHGPRPNLSTTIQQHRRLRLIRS